PVAGLPVAEAEVPAGGPGDTGQHPQRAVLPGSAAPHGVGFGDSQRAGAGGTWSCPSAPSCSAELFPSPSLVLRRSFDIFAQDVPYKDWKRFGRALDLLENDIVLAEMNDKYSLEPFFQMLNTWQNRQGMDASVNTLLETLHQINLGGIAEDISSKLVQQGYFQYEVS
uniref:Death domain-containing protein n=1 Tax=Bubo bubo TaxID=30461 RepID=A0A8C0FJT3_BUBBB